MQLHTTAEQACGYKQKQQNHDDLMACIFQLVLWQNGANLHKQAPAKTINHFVNNLLTIEKRVDYRTQKMNQRVLAIT
jgi:hypothetical protein